MSELKTSSIGIYFLYQILIRYTILFTPSLNQTIAGRVACKHETRIETNALLRALYLAQNKSCEGHVTYAALYGRLAGQKCVPANYCVSYIRVGRFGTYGSSSERAELIRVRLCPSLLK